MEIYGGRRKGIMNGGDKTARERERERIRFRTPSVHVAVRRTVGQTRNSGVRN